MTAFTKLFSSITDSSIWSEDSDTRVVWVTMLAMADQFGRVHAAIPGLAKRAMVSVQKTEEAIQKFLLPDPYSRTKDHEGRRIEVIGGGWRLLNHEMYRNLRSEDDRKEQNRLAQQRRREKLKNVSNSSANVSTGQQNQPPSAQAEAYTEAYTEKKKRASNAHKSQINPELFIEQLKANPIYSHINIDRELGKMDVWILANPGRVKSRRFVLNWLNKIEVPLGPSNPTIQRKKSGVFNEPLLDKPS